MTPGRLGDLSDPLTPAASGGGPQRPPRAGGGSLEHRVGAGGGVSSRLGVHLPKIESDHPSRASKCTSPMEKYIYVDQS